MENKQTTDELNESQESTGVGFEQSPTRPMTQNGDGHSSGFFDMAQSLGVSTEEPSLTEAANLIEKTIAEHVVFQSEHEPAMLALWVLHTYVWPKGRTTPYVLIRSPEKGSGKTTLLEVLECLVHRPMFTSNMSAAAMFRTIDSQAPTLLIDEADIVFRGKMAGTERANDIRGVLNGGYESGGTYARCEGDSNKVRLFKIYCPKAIASLSPLPDTVMDRCIEVALRRAKAGERYRDLDLDDLEAEMRPIKETLTG